MESKVRETISSLSSSQQVALWVILGLNQKSFHSSEVTESKLFTDEGRKSIGAILGALYRNGLIKKLAGGRDKLWKLNQDVLKNKELYRKEISKIKTYWR